MFIKSSYINITRLHVITVNIIFNILFKNNPKKLYKYGIVILQTIILHSAFYHCNPYLSPWSRPPIFNITVLREVPGYVPANQKAYDAIMAGVNLVPTTNHITT
jgi:hypothetical protein